MSKKKKKKLDISIKFTTSLSGLTRLMTAIQKGDPELAKQIQPIFLSALDEEMEKLKTKSDDTKV